MPNLNPQSNSFISAITDHPVLVAPDRGQLFGAFLQELAKSEEFTAMYDTAAAGHSASGNSEDDFWEGSHRPYTVTNGILQIPISGVLLNRFSHQFGRWATGYQYIEKAFNRGMDDPQVSKIALLIDSPGGEVAGNFELVEKMVARRGEKPVKAFANDHAYSAAYSIATAADRISMSRSGGVGSVGVVVMHAEMSELMKDWGIKITFIFAGKHKVDGNSYQKLSDSAKKRIQARVDRIYGEFVALVANNRDMEEQAVRDTEALTYDASDAIEVGFADGVGAFDEEMAAFAEEAAETETEFMALKPKNTPASAGNTDGLSDDTITQADHDAAVATASAEGSTGERTRINAILDSDEGKARPAAALSAATKTSMTTEEAIAFLGGLPEGKAEQPTEEPEGGVKTSEAPKAGAEATPFTEAMNGTDNPEVGAEAGSGDEEAGSSEAVSTNMLDALAVASGKTRKAA